MTNKKTPPFKRVLDLNILMCYNGCAVILQQLEGGVHRELHSLFFAIYWSKYYCILHLQVVG